MPDILLAIAKGLAGVPGLAPVFNPLVSLREEEKAAKANDALLAKLSDSREISRETLSDILAGILDIRADNQVIRQQMVDGFYAALKLVQQNHERISLLEEQPQLAPGVTNLEEQVCALIHENKATLATEGLLTLESLQDELVRCFSGDVGTLLAIAQPAGLPKGWVPTTVKPIQAYNDFLEAFEGLESASKARIARAIAKKKPGSELFRAWAAIYASSAD